MYCGDCVLVCEYIVVNVSDIRSQLAKGRAKEREKLQEIGVMDL